MTAELPARHWLPAAPPLVQCALPPMGLVPAEQIAPAVGAGALRDIRTGGSYLRFIVYNQRFQ